jgi:carboxypeptidase C (cathepsin A)
LTELGPLLLSDDSLQTDAYKASGIPTFIYNPHAWTRLGHLLSFDQPAPIGFSYCNSLNDSHGPHSCGGIVWNDTLTAQAAYQALLHFYKIHPEMASKKLYLTGESYAGIYIPTLAREIVQNQRLYDDDTPNDDGMNLFPLVGFAVGDGCLGIGTGICGNINRNSTDPPFNVWDLLFLAGHGQIPLSTFAETMHACQDEQQLDVAEFSKISGFVQSLWQSAKLTKRATDKALAMSCWEALDKVDQQAGGVYAYGYVSVCACGLWRMFRMETGVSLFWCSHPIISPQLVR